MLSLELLGVRLGDFTVTCFAPVCTDEDEGVEASIGAGADVGVVGMEVVGAPAGGGDTSILRRGDLPICDVGVCGCGGFEGDIGDVSGLCSSGNFRGGIL